MIDRVKLEASASNGHEPNEERWSIQLAPLDSWSARAFVAPSSNWTAQCSIGYLVKPEALEPAISGENWRRWNITGRSIEEVGPPRQSGTRAQGCCRPFLNSYLMESTVNFRGRNYVFTRVELVDKDELFPQVPVVTVYRIGAYTFGGIRDVMQDNKWQLGVGSDVTVYTKAAGLDAAYGNFPVSFQIFLRMRPGPAAHPMH